MNASFRTHVRRSPSALFRMLIAVSMCAAASAQNKPLPREDVIDAEAIGNGLCVSNVFQSGMVLQRDKPIVIWGWADVGENVTVSFGGHEQTATAGDDRSWKVTLPSVAAQLTPQSMTIRGSGRSLTLDNLLVGDVWVLGGQSNMEFPLDRVENGELEIISANFPGIRILTVPAQDGPEKKIGFPRLHEWSDWSGRHFRKGDWDVCSPEVVRELSAIGYVFARRIHMASQIPIGVIDVSRGGTTVETWTPDAVLRQMDSPHVKALLQEWDQKVAEWDAQADLDRRIAAYRDKVERFRKEGRELAAHETEPTDLKPGPAADQNRPGNCYAAMLGPLEGLSVKGAIFHQGYNICFNGTPGTVMYRHVFPEMILAWRAAFQDPTMPFGILSLCTEGDVQTLDNYCEMMANPGPFIREAQYQTFLDLYNTGDRNIGFVSTYDLRRRWYHPQLKIPAGERIARWALATQYGFEKSIRWKPPMVVDVQVQEDRIQLQLDEPAGAVDDGSPIQGFAIAGEDRRFHPALAEHLVTGHDNRGQPQTDKKVLVLTSPMVPRPIHYRYAWGRSPLGNLQADRVTDIPFATQRSDDWTLENVPLGIHDGEVTEKLNRQQHRQLIEFLRQQDLERRRQDARNLSPSPDTN
ncbi:MAG: hypothetical protein R3C49_14085 [Planctomycetaceae bacterium]